MSKPCKPAPTFHRLYHVQKCVQRRTSAAAPSPVLSSLLHSLGVLLLLLLLISFPPSLLPPYLCLHILSRPLFPPSHRPRHWTDATEGLRGRGGGCGETHLSLPLPFPPSLWRSKYRQLQIFRRPPTPLLCPAHGHYSERQRRYFRWVIPLLSFF